VLGRREAAAIGLVWLVWLGAIVATVGIGLGLGAYVWSPGWYEHHGPVARLCVGLQLVRPHCP